jgi:coenzyme PQQ biosynthesis protein PqqD
MTREISLNARPRLTTQARLQWDPTRKQQALLAPEGVLMLNATASDILTLCDGQRSVSVIITELGTRYNRVVDQEILTFLNRLIDKRLVEFEHE